MKKYTFILFMFFLVLKVEAQRDEFLSTKIKAHDGPVYSVAFSRDGKTLISGGEDHLVKVWDLPTQEERMALEGHFRPVKSVVFSNKGGYFYSGGDRSIRVWSPEGTEEKVLTGNNTDIWSIAISPDDNRLVSGSFEKKIHLWNYRKSEKPLELEAHDKSAMAVTISKDGKCLASGSLDETIIIWRMDSLKPIKTLEGHSDNIYDLKFVNGSKHLVSVSRDKTIRLWNVERGEIIRTFPGHGQGIFSVDVSPDEKLMVTASFDGEIKLWELSNANNIHTFQLDFEPIHCVRFSRDGSQIASAANDGTIRIWNIDNSIFVNHYFESEIQDEMNASDLFLPKLKGESRSDYQAREAKAEAAKKQMFDNYYQKYLELRAKQVIEKNTAQ